MIYVVTMDEESEASVMKKILILLTLIFIPFTFAGHHEEVDTTIIFTINLDVVDGKAESLKVMLDKMVPAVKASEPGTASYQYFMSADSKKVTLIEIYPSSQAAIAHMEAFAVSPFQEEFLNSLVITSFQVVGESSPALIEAMSPFTSDIRRLVNGFVR